MNSERRCHSHCCPSKRTHLEQIRVLTTVNVSDVKHAENLQKQRRTHLFNDLFHLQLDCTSSVNCADQIKLAAPLIPSHDAFDESFSALQTLTPQISSSRCFCTLSCCILTEGGGGTVNCCSHFSTNRIFAESYAGSRAVMEHQGAFTTR